MTERMTAAEAAQAQLESALSEARAALAALAAAGRASDANISTLTAELSQAQDDLMAARCDLQVLFPGYLTSKLTSKHCIRTRAEIKA